MIFDSLSGLIRVGLVAFVSYTSVILVLRLAGKRALAKLSAFDFVVTIALGSVLATVILSKDIALLEGILAFVALAALQWGVARLSVMSQRFRDLTRSQPCLLVRDGAYLLPRMAEERITKADIAAAVRQSGLGSLQEIGAVVLETDGSLSVLPTSSGSMELLEGVRGAGVDAPVTALRASRAEGRSSDRLGW